MPLFAGTNTTVDPTTLLGRSRGGAPSVGHAIPAGMVALPDGSGYYNPNDGSTYDWTGNQTGAPGSYLAPGGRTYAPPATTPPGQGVNNAQNPVPASTGGGSPSGGGGGGGGSAGFSYPFSSPFTGNPQLPAYATPPAFTPPTAQQAASDPGFQFALSQGLGAISNSAAAQGLWASGATGKAMTGYAENFANQFYGDVYNRALNTYLTNLGSQYVQPFEFNYQSANQTFQNQLALWQDWFNQKYLTGGLQQQFQLQS